MENFTVVNKRGRKPSCSSLVFLTVGLTPDQWKWLSLWASTGNRTFQMSEFFERAVKFWPAGPSVFGHSRKRIDKGAK